MKEEKDKVEYMVSKESHFFRNLAIVLLSFVFGTIGGVFGDRLCFEYNKGSVNTNISQEENRINNVVNVYGETSIEGYTDVEKIADIASNWTVGISIKNENKQTITLGDYTDNGSGIVYSKQGHILTSYHVVEEYIKNKNQIYVLFNTGERVPASVVGVDSKTDIAVLKVEKTDIKCATFSLGEVKVGQKVVAIGNPLGENLKGSVTVGYVSAIDRKINIDGNVFTLIQTDAAINFGNSGGALINSKGEVIGINTAKAYITGVEGINFATPYTVVDSVIKTILEDKKVSRPFIGLYGTNITKEAAKLLEIDDGILVKELIDNTPATLAGVKVNDYILKIDDRDVKTMEELNEYKNTLKPKDTVILTIKRMEDGKENILKIKIILGDEADYDT